MANCARDELLPKDGFRVPVILKLFFLQSPFLHAFKSAWKWQNCIFLTKPFKEKRSGEQPFPDTGLYVKCETISNFQGNL